MTRYAVVVVVDSEDESETLLKEIVSALEFDGRTTVLYLVVLNEAGRAVAVHMYKEILI